MYHYNWPGLQTMNRSIPYKSLKFYFGTLMVMMVVLVMLLLLHVCMCAWHICRCQSTTFSTVLSFYEVGPEIELRTSELVARTFVC